MPITFICPICSQYATVDDQLAGSVTSCPKCLKAVRIPEAGQFQRSPPAPQPPAPRDLPSEPGRSQEWDRDYRRRRDFDERDFDVSRERGYPPDYDYRNTEQGLHPGWKNVRTGLTLIRLAIVIIIFTILGVFVVGLVFSGIVRQRGPGPDPAEIVGGILALVAGLTLLACIVLLFVGEGLCCAAPAQSRAGGLAIGALVCHGLVTLLYILLIIIIVSRAGRFDPFHSIVGVLAILLSIGLGFSWQVLFILYLRRVARCFDNERLAQALNGLLTFHCIMFGGSFFFFILIGVMESSRRPVGHGMDGLEALAILGAILLFVGAIIDLIWFLSTLVRTRDSIGDRYRRSRRFDY